MDKAAFDYNRRQFVKNTVISTAGLAGLPAISSFGCSMAAEVEGANIIGPKKGYAPQVGTLVSMLDWMRGVVLGSVRGMTVEELDYLHDPKSNTIGGMLLHLAAIERYYQLNTFNGKKWDSKNKAPAIQWDMASELGDKARQQIKGNSIDFYLNVLGEVREHSLQELKKRDDTWLMAVDQKWPWGPTNNYCKWFHVCEHESNHNGQIKWVKGRIPESKK